MASDQQGPRARRTLFFLSLYLVLLGTCGTQQAAGTLSGAADRPQASAETIEATDAIRATQEVLAGAPFGRTLAGISLLLSGMLVIGALMIIVRRPTAPWWITQSAIANGLLAIAQALSQTHAIHTHRERLAELFQQVANQAATGDPAVGGTTQVWFLMIAPIPVAILEIAILTWITLRLRKPDVREALTRG